MFGRRKPRQIHTKLDEEADDGDEGVDDLLPRLEVEFAGLLLAVLVLELAAVEERLAGVDKVQEYADCGTLEEVEYPDEGGIGVHHAAIADD